MDNAGETRKDPKIVSFVIIKATQIHSAVSGTQPKWNRNKQRYAEHLLHISLISQRYKDDIEGAINNQKETTKSATQCTHAGVIFYAMGHA